MKPIVSACLALFGLAVGLVLGSSRSFAADVTWSDDAVPAGASQVSAGDDWNWIASNPAPAFGALAHQSNLAAGLHEHFFNFASETLSVAAGDVLFAYVYIDPSSAKLESFHDIVCAGQGALRHTSNNASFESGSVSQVFPVANSGLYPVGEPGRNFVGKSIFRPKPLAKEKRLDAKRKNRSLPLEGYTVGDDDGYNAWNQALGSAADMALRALNFSPSPWGPKFAATVTLPVMVVPDGTLWQVEFNEAGEPVSAPVTVEGVTYFCDHRARRTEKIGTSFYRVIRLPHVHFYTQTGLRNFLKIVRNQQAIFWHTTFAEGPIEDFQSRFSPNA